MKDGMLTELTVFFPLVGALKDCGLSARVSSDFLWFLWADLWENQARSTLQVLDTHCAPTYQKTLRFVCPPMLSSACSFGGG